MPFDSERSQALCLDLDSALRDTDDQSVQRLPGRFNIHKPILLPRGPLSAARKIMMATESPSQNEYE